MQDYGVFPKTYADAVNYTLACLSDDERSALRASQKEDLWTFHLSLGQSVRNKLGIWSGKTQLLKSCATKSGVEKIHEDDASMLILEGVWERLTDTPHSL